MNLRNEIGFSAITPTNINGKRLYRWMIGLRSPGCSYAWNNKMGGCFNCGIRYSSTRCKNVTTKNYLQQIKNAIHKISAKYDIKKIGEIDIFNGGNFFNDLEIPEDTQIKILEILSNCTHAKNFLVETLPNYINLKKIKRAKSAIGNKELEVSIGLETSSDFIRRKCINKPFNLKEFQRSVKILQKCNVKLVAYLAIKPAFLDEREAIKDAVASAKYVFNIKKKNNLKCKVRLQPFFVHSSEILLGKLYQAGLYRPSWLWSIVYIIKKLHNKGDFDIGTIDEDPKPFAVSENRTNGRKCKCSEGFYRAVIKYNEEKQLKDIEGLTCSCKNKWKSELKKNNIPLDERINKYMKNDKI